MKTSANCSTITLVTALSAVFVLVASQGIDRLDKSQSANMDPRVFVSRGNSERLALERLLSRVDAERNVLADILAPGVLPSKRDAEVDAMKDMFFGVRG